MPAANQPDSTGSKIRWLARPWPAGLVCAGAALFLCCPFLRAADLTSNNVTVSPPPDKQIYAAYAGSAACRDCHQEIYDAWAGSHHALAERLPDTNVDNPAFVPACTLRQGAWPTTFQKTAGHYELITAGLKSTQEVFRVDRVIGQSPLRQMLVPFPGGRWQAAEAAYDPRSNQWFDVYGTENRHPGEWGHWTGRGMNWNSMCATCHNTRLLKNYDAASDTYQTTMAERGVGCEACHGPMKAHSDWQYAHKGQPGSKDSTLRHFTRDQMLDTCAACHSRRGEITGDPVPGDSYFDHHLLSIVDDSDLFYPDGQVHDEDYEVTAFLGSKMYQHGVRCMDCHDVHTAKVRLPGNLLCLSCHGPGHADTNAPIINPVTHSHHRVFGFDTNGVVIVSAVSAYNTDHPQESGGECINCHMPQTVYMQRHWRHDHGFTIPDPLLTKQFGIPNACNRCHQDKDPAWALKYVEQWYGTNMDRPTRQRAQAIARARNGDDTARDPLLKILQTDDQGYWRAVAAGLLEHWVGEAPVAGALVGRLSDTNALVRQYVVQTLAALGDAASPEIHAALKERLGDPSRNVRVAAALALVPELDPHSRAGRDLTQMLAQNADQPAGQIQLANYDLVRGDITNALRHFRTAEQWDAYSPDIRYTVALAFGQLGRTQDAANELQEAIRLAPGEAEYHFQLGLAWNELNEPAKALAELETAAKLNPHHARALYNLGLARYAAGNSAGAIAALSDAEKADPHDPGIPYAQATILAQLGRLDEARQAARRALAIDPQDADAIHLLEQLGAK